MTFAGELLTMAEQLIKSGVHPTEILAGYQSGIKKCMELFDAAEKYQVKDLKSLEEITKIIKPVVGTKLSFNQDTTIAPLVAAACISVLPSDPLRFNEENVRVAKMLGGSIFDSQMIKGLVVVRNIEGSVTRAEVRLSI